MPRVRRKNQFSYAERYAVWLHHEKRCWFCTEPLRLIDTTIDHVIPESLLAEPDKLKRIIRELGLPETFDVNGFENWLPCHHHCNQSKSNKQFGPTPLMQLLLERVAFKAPLVAKTANATIVNVAKDKVFAKIFAALEKQQLDVADLHEFVEHLGAVPVNRILPEDMILLDNGYWTYRHDVVRECECQCERRVCVGEETKVRCLFTKKLSPWIVKKGLYWRCYDEVVTCPRCGIEHKRGHIGGGWICRHPYRDQQLQSDAL